MRLIGIARCGCQRRHLCRTRMCHELEEALKTQDAIERLRTEPERIHGPAPDRAFADSEVPYQTRHHGRGTVRVARHVPKDGERHSIRRIDVRDTVSKRALESLRDILGRRRLAEPIPQAPRFGAPEILERP